MGSRSTRRLDGCGAVASTAEPCGVAGVTPAKGLVVGGEAERVGAVAEGGREGGRDRESDFQMGG